MAEPESSLSEKSSTGLDANIAGMLCYFGFFITGILFLVLEKQSSYVRFHAMQSTFAFIGLFAAHWVGLLVPVLGWVFSCLVQMAAIGVWIFMMVKAFQGERYKLPIAGDMVEKQLAAY